MSCISIQGKTLDVLVMRCNNLKNTSTLTSQDPYVCLEYGGTSFRTTICRGGGTNPKFGERFSFTLIEGLKEINISVHNAHTVTKDTLIGKGSVNLRNFISLGNDKPNVDIYTLTNKRTAGTVCLILSSPDLMQQQGPSFATQHSFHGSSHSAIQPYPPTPKYCPSAPVQPYPVPPAKPYTQPGTSYYTALSPSHSSQAYPTPSQPPVYCSYLHEGSGQVITVHSIQEWDQWLHMAKDTKKLIVVDFNATWCEPSRTIFPCFTELARIYPNVIFLEVDVNELNSVTVDWGVKATPTFMFLRKGMILEKLVGVKEGLQQALVKHMVSSSN